MKRLPGRFGSWRHVALRSATSDQALTRSILWGMMADQPQEHLAKVFGDLAVEMQAQKCTSDTLRSITNAAPKVVPGARWAGISLIRGRNIVAQVPTSRAVAEVDQLQCDLDQGPCLTALREYHTWHIDDMRTDTRWPDFGREAQQRGMLSMLSFRPDRGRPRCAAAEARGLNLGEL